MLMLYKKADGTDGTVRLKQESLGTPFTIGRGREADLTLSDTRASRIHAAIIYWDSMHIIRDMDSANGVYVNGSREKLCFIKPGDTLRIADTELRLLSSGSHDDVTMDGFEVQP